jgi:hypothetical protein
MKRKRLLGLALLTATLPASARSRSLFAQSRVEGPEEQADELPGTSELALRCGSSSIRSIRATELLATGGDDERIFIQRLYLLAAAKLKAAVGHETEKAWPVPNLVDRQPVSVAIQYRDGAARFHHWSAPLLRTIRRPETNLRLD